MEISSVATAGNYWWLEGAGFTLAIAVLYFIALRFIDKLTIEFDDDDEVKKKKERYFVMGLITMGLFVLWLVVMVVVINP